MTKEQAERLFQVSIASIELSTRDSYAAGLKHFNDWCDRNGRSEEERMPAAPGLIAAFLMEKAGTVGASAVNNWMAGLRLWHTINGAEWHGDSQVVTLVRKGVKKLAPISAKRAARPPITIEHMSILHQSLDHSSPKDVAIWATSAIAFWGCCRLGELTYPSKAPFMENHYVRRSAPLTFNSTRNDAQGRSTEYATLVIPWSKTTAYDNVKVSITSRPDDPLCPIKALRRHLEINAGVPPEATFFSYVDILSPLGYTQLDRDSVVERGNAIWCDHGMPRVTGHGFRIGGSTHLLLLGTPPDIVAMQGRWKSQAFLVYWREIESILPIFMSTHNSSDAYVAMTANMKAYSLKHGKQKS
ncbi:DNA breaking-rejoining enzyme [Ephemerocybe angulata]|uniref:DNA breaking-rejoining enzyme n=1 Tax=Ephemerocybe angulata TaxID=980116 RepID=A0A8H6ME48_9AGAR|nr:DNA breaking-rejoining enzyme [Tulosesus angulatus]